MPILVVNWTGEEFVAIQLLNKNKFKNEIKYCCIPPKSNFGDLVIRKKLKSTEKQYNKSKQKMEFILKNSKRKNKIKSIFLLYYFHKEYNIVNQFFENY